MYSAAFASVILYRNVYISITVNEKGAVTEVVVMENTMAVNQNQAFAEAAVAAVEQWRYEPALINGIPAWVNFGITIAFTPDGTTRDQSSPVEPNPSMFITEPPGSVRSVPPSVVYNGRTYYTVMSGMFAPVVQADISRLEVMAKTAKEGWPDGVSRIPFIVYNVYVNENGNVDGVLQTTPNPRISSLEEEIKSIRVLSPAGYNGEAIPSWTMLTIELQ